MKKIIKRIKRIFQRGRCPCCESRISRFEAAKIDRRFIRQAQNIERMVEDAVADAYNTAWERAAAAEE